jgi:catechol 2,3-dioxygenase-like lactoylglutathione lyase family enzyme
MLLSLGHVTLLSADFARTERFYCDLLGLRVGPRPAIRVPGRWLYVGDAAVLHVLPRNAPPPQDARPVVDHFALNAHDRAGFERRLEAAGQPFESRRLAATEIWQVFLTDPDGARVELCFAHENLAVAGGAPTVADNRPAGGS